MIYTALDGHQTSVYPFPNAVSVPDCWSPTGVVYMSQDVYDAWLKSIGERKPVPEEVIETRPGRCECGSAAVGSSMHATYCPAFEK